MSISQVESELGSRFGGVCSQSGDDVDIVLPYRWESGYP